MKTISSLFLRLCFFVVVIPPSHAQVFDFYRIELPTPIFANAAFPITVTSRGVCTYPYQQNIQAPDFEVIGQQINMTVYLRPFGQNVVPTPPCANRTQIYAFPVLQTGNYQIKAFVRFFQDIGAGSFGSRIPQGEFNFQVADAVPVTQIPATSSWSLALLLLGIFGAARWASGVSGR